MSSMVRGSKPLSCFSTLVSFKSRLATRSSWTSRLQFHTSTLRQKRRVNSWPKAQSPCAFPEPVAPNRSTFSRRSRNVPSRSVWYWRATFAGRRFRSNVSRFLSKGRRDWRNKRSILFVRRSSHSARASSSRYCSYDSVSRSARRASSSNCRRIVGRCNSRKCSVNTFRMSAIFHLPVRQQTIVRSQVRHHDRHLRGRRRRLLATHEILDVHTRQHTLFRQEHTQGVVHQRLALARRQVQNLQVFPVCPARDALAQRVVGHAEPARGEQLGAVLIMREGAGLAHQPVDDVPVIDAMLVAAMQAPQPLQA